MICQIGRKEILENLLSLRFILSLLLVISLFSVSGFVFVGKHRQEQLDYWEETSKNFSALNENAKQLYNLAFYKQKIWKKPKSLSFCAEGFEKSLPNYFEFNVFAMEYPKIKSSSNFMLERFVDIDWVFIISLILSFVALLLTYNGICGERETGTLRLMLAGAIPRYEVLLGKYLGAMFTLGIPLLLGLLINLIIVVSSNVIVVGIGDWMRIFTIVLLSFLYLSGFVFLGLFISSRTVYSSSSIVVLLLLWVGVVVLVPSFGRIISNTFYKLPAKAEVDKKKTEAMKEIKKNALSGKYGEKALSYCPDPKIRSLVNPPARAIHSNARTSGKNRIFEEHHSKMINQPAVGRRVTCISPVVIYQRASEAITGTGLNRSMSLYQQIKRYQHDLKEYIRSEDQKDSDSLHLIFAEEFVVKAWGTISKKPVNVNTIPKFQEQEAKLLESLQLVIWDIGLLSLFNLFFFMASFVSFLKYDVR